MSSTYFDFFNLSSSFLSSISSAKATLEGPVFSLLISLVYLANLKFFFVIFHYRNLMFLYFFENFFAAICVALSFCCFLFLGTLIISIHCSSFSIAFLLFLFKRFTLKLLMASSCCFLNSSKSRTLFAASSMLSLLNKSS